MKQQQQHFLFIIIVSCLFIWCCCGINFVALEDWEVLTAISQTRAIFRKSFSAYVSAAYPNDELKPLSCGSSNGYGGVGITMLDSLDSLLAVADDSLEFERRIQQVTSTFSNFDIDANVSVFELNIRALGGLLSSYLLAEERGLATETRPKLLNLAEDLGRRLLPAFETVTGIPYGTVNLRYGVPPKETTITSVAGGSTFALEFGVLSRLTGDRVFDDVARAAVIAIWERRSPIGLLGNHIDTATGRWIAVDATIGSSVDSFYEYLLKSSILFNDGEMLKMFEEAYEAAEKHIRNGIWYPYVNMMTAQISLPVVDSLSSFWPGLQVLNGNVFDAEKIALSTFVPIWNRYGAIPEMWLISQQRVMKDRTNYPLRPELAESLFMLSLVHPNRDSLIFQKFGRNMLESIDTYCSTNCGYAALKDVRSKQKEDLMNSFFLAETLKYLEALFDKSHWLRSGKYIFTTEAHPIPISYRFSGPPPWKKHLCPVPKKIPMCPNIENVETAIIIFEKNPYSPKRAQTRRLEEIQRLKNELYKLSIDHIDFICNSTEHSCEIARLKPPLTSPPPPPPQPTSPPQ